MPRCQETLDEDQETLDRNDLGLQRVSAHWGRTAEVYGRGSMEPPNPPPSGEGAVAQVELHTTYQLLQSTPRGAHSSRCPVRRREGANDRFVARTSAVARVVLHTAPYSYSGPHDKCPVSTHPELRVRRAYAEPAAVYWSGSWSGRDRSGPVTEPLTSAGARPTEPGVSRLYAYCQPSPSASWLCSVVLTTRTEVPMVVSAK